MEHRHLPEAGETPPHAQETREFADFLLALKNQVQIDLMKRQPGYPLGKGVSAEDQWADDIWVKEGYSEKFEIFFSTYLNNPTERRESLLVAYQQSKNPKKLLKKLAGYFHDYFLLHDFGKEGVKPNPKVKRRVERILAEHPQGSDGETLH